jgi:hypothetical protein
MNNRLKKIGDRIAKEHKYEFVSNEEINREKIRNLKQGGNVVWAYVLSGVSLMAALIALVTKFMGS